MKIHDVEQGSAAWFTLRRGIPTASAFHRIITPAKMQPSAQRYDYACQLIAEKLLNTTLQSLEGLEHVERGKELEPAAVRQYEFVNEVETYPVGFITTDDGLVGASPDRLLKGRNRGLEIKCPAPNTQMSYLLFGPDDKYRCQVQGQIWVAELDDSDFYAYAERMPPVSIRTPRDDKFITALRAAVTQFVTELEEWTDKARSLGVFQAFAEIVMPLEREYEADISEPLAAALAAVGAPLKEVVPFDDLDREMGWDKPDAADRLDTPAMEA